MADFSKYGAVKTQTSNGIDFSKYGTITNQTVQPQGTESGKSIPRKVFDFFTGATQRFGKTVGEAINAPKAAGMYGEDLTKHTEDQAKIIKAIKQNRELGIDTGRLEALLQDHIKNTPKLEDYTGDVINKTTKQVLGEAAAVIPEVLQGGIYGKGASIAADEALTLPQKFIQGAKVTAPYGLVAGGAEAAAQGGSTGDIVKGAATGGTIAGLTGGTIEAGIGGIGKVSNAISNKFSKPSADLVAGEVTPEAEKIANKILQGSERPTPQVIEALKTYDPKKVVDYRSGIAEAENKIGVISKQEDALLNKSLNRNKSSAFNLPVEGTSVKHNYVTDAIGELEKFYKSTNNIKGQSEIAALKTKLRTEGLTAKEINDLARTHGRLRSGFNPSTGELASGLNKQGFENTRKGLKSTVKSVVPENIKKQFEKLESQSSSHFRIRDMFEDVDKRVIKAQRSLEDTGLLQKLGQKGGTILDLVTGNFLRGFVREVANFNATKSMSALDLENILQKNLTKLSKLEEIINPEVVKKTPPETIIKKLSDFLNKEVVLNEPPKKAPQVKTPARKPTTVKKLRETMRVR